MKYPKTPVAQTIIQLCKAKHIKHIVISPGSRNAPLIIGFTNDAYFSCYSIVDERCAAFFALGIAQQLQEPTAIVCTSGTALLNYYPAIAEAFYSDIPLVVLSADRPKHLVGVGDGQTINQKGVYANHILYSANLKLDLKDDIIEEKEELPIFKNLESKLETLLGLKQSIQQYNEAEINKAINAAILKKGPVHINCPFDEPLYELVDTLQVNPKSVDDGNHPQIDDSVLELCVNDWNRALKKMVLVGVNPPHQIEQQWLEGLAEDESVIVFTETTSNLHHGTFFPNIDKLIAPLNKNDFKSLQPDILLTFGGLVVSKKIKSFLRQYKPKQHWHIDEKKANDTFFSLNRYIKTAPNYFFSKFLPKTVSLESSYWNTWESIKNKRIKKHDEYLNSIPFSDLMAFNVVLRSLPNDTVLQLGNSSAVRYAQLFKLQKTLDVFCNRGTSGIEGSTSTAIGNAIVNNKQTILIIGDLSFLYDSNALWNNYIPNNFRILVINNGGGGIFRILQGHKGIENFDTFFETNHNLTAEYLCKMNGFNYESVLDEGDLKCALNTFYLLSEQPKLLEIFTPRTINDKVLIEYFEYIK